MGKLIDLTGVKFGRLLVIERSGKVKNGQSARWLCKCDCGNETIAISNNLKNKFTTSCGCYSKEVAKKVNTKHGLHKHRLYRTWKNMKSRCYCKSASRFSNYGGRGITVCDEWRNDFSAFYNWAINNGYQEKLSIERLNIDGNYEPSNCCFITMQNQHFNKKNTFLITFNNETKSLAEWSRLYGINRNTLKNRIVRGWDIESALTSNVRGENNAT